jgi:replicative DNA helicase
VTTSDLTPEQAADIAADEASSRAFLADQALRDLRAREDAKRLFAAERALLDAAERRLRLVTGWDFLDESEDEDHAIWGDGDRWLWAPGESLMLFGGNGVFKSTLAHLLVWGRLGLLDDGLVLGMPVEPTTGRVLYLAGDRPRQIKRAMRRLRREAHKEVLRDRLIVHEGPLPFDLASSKDGLADLAQHYEATDIVIDSIKDFCSKPSDDEAGNGYNRARQECIARGMQWLECHHNRKQQQGQGKSNALDDVYGSRWLTAGAGSVLVLYTDEEGAPVVDVRQLKSPGEFIDPMRVHVDKATGTMAGDRKPDPVSWIRSHGVVGVTVAEYARWSGTKANAAREWLKTRVKWGLLEVVVPEHEDRLTRYRTTVGTVPQRSQNVYQQDGLGDF